MAAAADEITEEATVDADIMLMATTAAEMIIKIPASSWPQVVKKIETNHNPTNREEMDPLKYSSRSTVQKQGNDVRGSLNGARFGRGRWYKMSHHLDV